MNDFRIVFVCHGNVCRSPMAVGLLRRKLEEAGLADGVEVASAGFLEGGRPMSYGTEQVLRERGIRLDHISRCLDPEELRNADLVLTMEERQAEELRRMGVKAFPLIAYATRGRRRGDVEDPYGLPVEEYRKTAELLAPLLDELIGRLLSEGKLKKDADE